MAECRRNEASARTPRVFLMVEIMAVVRIHLVVPERTGELFNAHTHGLEAFGHKEFQVLVPGFCWSAALTLLNCHADGVINRGERFLPGERGETDGIIIGYEEAAGDFPGDPTRLRIIDMPAEYDPGVVRILRAGSRGAGEG